MSENQTLYERLGGKDAITTLAYIFSGFVADDPRIAHYFENMDMNRLRGHHKTFLIYALGGPNVYDGKDLRSGHAHLNLSDGDFDAVADNLKKAMDTINIPGDLQSEVLALVSGTRDDVLNR